MPDSTNNAPSMDVVQHNDSGVTGSGIVAQALMQSGFNIQSLRTQDLLRKDEWKDFDDRIVQVASERLVGVADLMQAGLTYNVKNALGTTKVEWERVSEMTGADISMGGLTNSENDRVTYDLQSVPLPIIHKDFFINIRALEASRNRGESLDTTQAEIAARVVSEKVESLLFNGSLLAGTSNKIYGYLNAPNRITGSVTADWATATGAQIVADALAMIAAAHAKKQFGPFTIYLPYTAYVHLGDDYKANSDKTIMQRLQEIPGINTIKPSVNVTAGSVLMIQMTRDVIDMIDGIQPTMIQWSSHGGMLLNFKVMAIMVPRVKSDKNAQSGIVHYS